MIQSTAEETKGTYCRFVVTGDGKYALEPVKVPQHVIEARAEQQRQLEVHKNVQRNRERYAAFDFHSVLFLVAAIGICMFFCCCYLALQSQVTSKLSQITALEYEVEDLVEDNDLRAQRLSDGIDLNTVSEIAKDKLGMTEMTQDQVEYFSVDQKDYMLQYEDLAN